MPAPAKLANPRDIVDEQTLGQWAKDWLRWVSNADAAHPVGDPFGITANPQSDAANATLGQSGPVFFLCGGGWGDPNPANLSNDPTINVPAGKDIFLPLINVIDVETGGPQDSTLPEWPSTHLPYSVEAQLVAGLGSASIDEAHLTVATTSDPTHPFLKLEWPASEFAIADSGVFSIAPRTGSYLANVTGGNPVTAADVAGRWAMIENLPQGDYVVNFGGSGRAVYDPLAPDHSKEIFGGPNGSDWKINTTDILHVA